VSRLNNTSTSPKKKNMSPARPNKPKAEFWHTREPEGFVG